MGRVEHPVEQCGRLPYAMHGQLVKPCSKGFGGDAITAAQITKHAQRPQAVVIDEDWLLRAAFAGPGAVQQGVEVGIGNIEPALQADHSLQSVVPLKAGVEQVNRRRSIAAQRQVLLPLVVGAIDKTGTHGMVLAHLICGLHHIGRQSRPKAAASQQFLKLKAVESGVLHELLLLGDRLFVAIVFFVKGRRVVQCLLPANVFG